MALRHAIAAPDEELALEIIASGVADDLERWGQVGLAAEALRRFCARFPLGVGEIRRLAAYRRYGSLLRQSGDVQGSLAVLLACIDALGELSGTREELLLDLALSNTLRQLQRAEEALSYAGRGLQIARALGDRVDEAHLRQELSRTHWSLNRSKEARQLAAQAVEIADATDAGEVAVWAHESLGAILVGMRDLPGARFHQEQALTRARALGMRRAEARALGRLADIARRQGRLDDAIDVGKQAIAIRQASHDQVGESIDLAALSSACSARGDVDAATRHLLEALRVAMASGHELLILRRLVDLANHLSSLGQHGPALVCCGGALRLSRAGSSMENKVKRLAPRVQKGMGGDLSLDRAPETARSAATPEARAAHTHIAASEWDALFSVGGQVGGEGAE